MHSAEHGKKNNTKNNIRRVSLSALLLALAVPQLSVAIPPPKASVDKSSESEKLDVAGEAEKAVKKASTEEIKEKTEEGTEKEGADDATDSDSVDKKDDDTPDAVATADSKSVQLDTISIIGDSEAQKRATGSVHKVDKKALEQWKYTDIHRVLEDTPGVYIRQEDGYGLRPNIGMRGSGSDRSKKIALMEDGILFAPAPYSAPAAYYFPLIPRMQSVETFKGPAAIKYGPNTVGGAINFVSREIPGSDDDEHKKGAIDLGVGSDGFAKLHGFYGDSKDRYGWLLEGVHLRADGFKELDGGGNTGFDKNDVLLKARFNSDIDDDVYHQFDFKIGYADEVSNETYLGLTDEDFKKNPVRRYAGSQKDEMVWDHQQYSLSHFFDPGDDYTLTTTAYRRDFTRVWDKLNGFSDGAPGLKEILANPDSAVNRVYYDVVSGTTDSSSPKTTLILGANARDFIAQGIQTQLEWEPEIAGKQHSFDIGVRYHTDEIIRNHSERGFVMRDGKLVRDGNPKLPTTRNRATAKALAIHAQDEVTIGKLTVKGGFRTELIKTTFTNRVNGETLKRDDNIIIPGIGFNYKSTPNLRLLAGINKGFVPAPPGSDSEVKSEESINYELGLRYSNQALKAEVIGFFNDYSNLTGSCTFSSGCAASQLDLGFNAGETNVWGLEAGISKTFASNVQKRFRFPVQLNYTLTQSEFQNSFTSPRPDLKDVKKGDSLPYLPEHQIALKVGMSRFKWNSGLAFKYVSPMRTTAGKGKASVSGKTDAQVRVDFSSNYQINDRSQAYFTIDNVLDDQAIVARRPFGSLTSKPRTFLVGYKMDF